jgi:transposase
MWGLLMSQGLCDVKFGRAFEESLSKLELWDGGPLPVHLEREILRIRERIELVERQISEIRKARARWLEQPSTEADLCAEKLYRIKAVGENSAWLFSTEFFAWREFKNGKQVGALGGLTGTPHASGNMSRERGISKAGNARVRRMAVELAWSWQRWQPQSALTKWFKERFGSGGSRMRRIGIVALARKILVALWRYLEFGEVPEGAVLKVV